MKQSLSQNTIPKMKTNTTLKTNSEIPATQGMKILLSKAPSHRQQSIFHVPEKEHILQLYY